MSFAVPSRKALEDAVGALDAHGVAHSEVKDLGEAFGIAVLGFRDPDNVQSELSSPGDAQSSMALATRRVATGTGQQFDDTFMSPGSTARSWWRASSFADLKRAPGVTWLEPGWVADAS